MSDSELKQIGFQADTDTFGLCGLFHLHLRCGWFSGKLRFAVFVLLGMLAVRIIAASPKHAFASTSLPELPAASTAGIGLLYSAGFRLALHLSFCFFLSPYARQSIIVRCSIAALRIAVATPPITAFFTTRTTLQKTAIA